MDSRSNLEQHPPIKVDITEIILNKSVIESIYSKIFIGKWKGEQYAIKTVEYHKYFNNEVAALTILHRLKAPNIIGLHGYVETPHQYIVLEYLPQGDLYEYIHSKKPFAWQTRYCILEDIATAIQFMHAHEFLHRDIKPENVLLTNDMRAKLCDFGFSVSCHAAKVDLIPHGTYALAAPEVLKGYGSIKQSDTYSMGVTIWETMTRKNPFAQYDSDNEDDAIEIMKLKESGHPEVIPDYFPKGLAFLVQWCWKVNPDERPSTDQLHAVIHGVAKIHQEKIKQRMRVRHQRIIEQSHTFNRKSNSM